MITHLETTAAEHASSRVLRVHVAVGALSGVDPESLDFAFPLAAEGTVAEGAELDIEFVPARMVCRTCAHEWEPEFPVPLCEACESIDVDCPRGRELMVKSVELETD